ATVAAAAAARATSTPAAPMSASSATPMRPAAAMRTIGAPGAHGFAVRIFAVEVRFAVFVGEVAAALKGDGFFGSRRHWLAPLLPALAFGRRSTVALAARGRLRHFCTLLFQNRFARQLDAVAFDAQDLHQHLIALFELVADFADAVLGDLADVQEAIGSGDDLHEGAELGDSNDFAQIRLADFRHRGQVVDHLNGFLRGRTVARSHVDLAGVVHVDLHASLVDDAADHLAARADQVANLVHRDLQGVNARSEAGDVLAAAGDGFFHLVQDEEAAAACLLQRFVHDLGGDARHLDVHLQGGYAFA